MTRKIKRNVLTDEIYAIIKENILSHKILPGEKINIDQLARELEVSNIPIREALSRLSTEGLVHVVPYKGMFAIQLDLKELNEIFELRIYLEPMAIKKAVPHIPEARLIELREQMDFSPDLIPSESSEFVEHVRQMNSNLHGLILQYCGNDTLQKLVHSYIERIQSYLLLMQKSMRIHSVEQEWQEHQEIIRQLLDRNAEGASEAMRHHLQQSCARTTSFFE